MNLAFVRARRRNIVRNRAVDGASSHKRIKKGAGMRRSPYRGIAWLCLRVFAAIAWTCTVAYAAIPEATSLVVDEAGVLSEEARDALRSRLTAIQDSQRAQITVLIAKDADGAPLADYSLRVAGSWRLGRSGRDDGC
jgi:uncharacterized membrane protein YgcG